MNAEKLKMRINSNPVIAAVRNAEELSDAVNSPVEVIFLLNSSILTIKENIDLCHENGKIVLVHFDLVSGLGSNEDAVRYVATFGPDGIISTKSNILKIASEQGLFTIQRFFIVDSRSCETMQKSLYAFKPDMAEVMPGILFNEIERIIHINEIDVICGGMVEDKQTVIKLLSSGAMGISTSKSSLWSI